jgi:hypothetical protein
MVSEPLKKSKQRSTVKTASFLKETREQEALMSQRTAKTIRYELTFRLNRIDFFKQW